MMYGSIQKWGNSQGIRLSKAVLSAAQIKENDKVEIITSENSIIIRKTVRYQSLDALFEGYHGDYTPQELDSGESVGLEVFE
jgi:antitoxin MazE